MCYWKGGGDFHAAACVPAAVHLFFVRGEKWGKRDEIVSAVPKWSFF